MSRIAVLGLGAMGRRMAAHLLDDHDLVVWNRTASRADALVAKGATGAETPRDAAEGADVVITMVTDDAAARAVWLDPETGALAGLGHDALAIECSTVTPGWVRELGAHVSEAGGRLVESPVLGTTWQADSAELVALLGGDETDRAAAAEVVDLFCKASLHIGELGQGAVFKLLVNAFFATQVAALGELLKMAEANGLDVARTFDTLKGMPVTAPKVAAVGGQMVEGMHEPGFPIDLVAKDLGYAGTIGAGPIVGAAEGRYRAAADAGFGEAHLAAVERFED